MTGLFDGTLARGGAAAVVSDGLDLAAVFTAAADAGNPVPPRRWPVWRGPTATTWSWVAR